MYIWQLTTTKKKMFYFQIVVGVLSRGNAITSMPISLGQGSKLQILVENQGRINYGQIIDFKGIIGDVLLNNVPVLNWTITGFPLDHGDSVVRFANDENDMSGKIEPQFSSDNNQVLRNGPAIFHCTFDIKGSEIYDTYIDTSHWGKVCTIHHIMQLTSTLVNLHPFFLLFCSCIRIRLG